jgi:hypothetical protein
LNYAKHLRKNIVGLALNAVFESLSDGKTNKGPNRTRNSSLQSDNVDEEIDVIDDEKNFNQVKIRAEIH